MSNIVKMLMVISFVLIILFSMGCQQKVGDDRDEHGCIPSAGYEWCEVTQKCQRPFEEPCEHEPVMETTTNTEIEINLTE